MALCGLLLICLLVANLTLTVAFGSVEDADRGLRELRRLGFRPRRVLDVGALFGEWTRRCRRIFPRATFLLIDASDHQESWLDLTKAGVDTAVTLLDSTDRDVEWHEHSLSKQGSSIYKESTGLFVNVEGVARRAEGLDRFIQRTGRVGDPFDLVKLMVQGAEMAVLSGAPNVLAQAEAVQMHMPFAGSWNQGAPEFGEVVRFMTEAGFAPFDVGMQHRMWPKCNNTCRSQGYLVKLDILFVRRNSRFLRMLQHDVESLNWGA